MDHQLDERHDARHVGRQVDTAGSSHAGPRLWFPPRLANGSQLARDESAPRGIEIGGVAGRLVLERLLPGGGGEGTGRAADVGEKITAGVALAGAIVALITLRGRPAPEAAARDEMAEVDQQAEPDREAVAL